MCKKCESWPLDSVRRDQLIADDSICKHIGKLQGGGAGEEVGGKRTFVTRVDLSGKVLRGTDMRCGAGIRRKIVLAAPLPRYTFAPVWKRIPHGIFRTRVPLCPKIVSSQRQAINPVSAFSHPNTAKGYIHSFTGSLEGTKASYPWEYILLFISPSFRYDDIIMLPTLQLNSKQDS